MKTRKVTVTFNIKVMDDVPLDRSLRAVENMMRHEMSFAENVHVSITDEPTKTPIPPKN